MTISVKSAHDLPDPCAGTADSSGSQPGELLLTPVYLFCMSVNVTDSSVSVLYECQCLTPVPVVKRYNR